MSCNFSPEQELSPLETRRSYIYSLINHPKMDFVVLMYLLAPVKWEQPSPRTTKQLEKCGGRWWHNSLLGLPYLNFFSIFIICLFNRPFQEWKTHFKISKVTLIYLTLISHRSLDNIHCCNIVKIKLSVRINCFLMTKDLLDESLFI